MKKFFVIYIVLFIVGLSLLLGMKHILYGDNTKDSTILLASDYLIKNEESKEDRYSKHKPTKITEDIGKVNKNPYANCKVLSHDESYNINVKKVKEVQLYIESDYLKNVYYYSKEEKDKKFLKKKFEEGIDYDDYENSYYVAFIMNDNTCLLDSVALSKEEIESVKNTYTRSKIQLSENAKLGISYDENPYKNLDYTPEEEKEIIKLLTKIQPVYNDDMGPTGSYFISDLKYDLLMVYQIENKEEETYAYRISDSKELVELLNKINKRNINKVTKENFDLEYVYIVEYKNNIIKDQYYVRTAQEKVREYVKTHPVEEYAQGDYYKIWFLSNRDEFYYINYPINDELKEILNSKGVEKGE